MIKFKDYPNAQPYKALDCMSYWQWCKTIEVGAWRDRAEQLAKWDDNTPITEAEFLKIAGPLK